MEVDTLNKLKLLINNYYIYIKNHKLGVIRAIIGQQANATDLKLK